MSSKVMQIVTDGLVKAIEAGVPVWRPGYLQTNPRNMASNRPYRGMNALATAVACAGRDWKQPLFLTLRQVHEKGGRVLDEEFHNGVPILFYKWSRKNSDVKAEDGGGKDGAGAAAGEKRESRCMTRYFTIYNVAQTDLPIPEIQGLPDKDPIAECEAVVDRWGKVVSIKQSEGNRNFYRRDDDHIEVVARPRWEKIEWYYATLFHEGMHSTGHPSRLGRFLDWEEGRESRSHEELIAEIGASMLCAELGIHTKDTQENNAAYCASWLTWFREQKRDIGMEIMCAAQAAQRGVDMILGREPNRGGDDEDKADPQ